MGTTPQRARRRNCGSGLGGRGRRLALDRVFQAGFHRRTVRHQPGAGLLRKAVEVSNDAQLAGLAGNGRSRRIGTALAAPDGSGELAALGIRFVLDLSGAGAAALTDDAWQRVATVPGAALYRYNPAS